MEIKKSEKANLENKKLLFTELGLVISLAITFGAFEYTSKETKVTMLDDTAEVVLEEEIIPITQETPPPPPAAPKIPILSDQIDIVDDEIELDDDMFMNLEDDASLGVEIMDYVDPPFGLIFFCPSRGKPNFPRGRIRPFAENGAVDFSVGTAFPCNSHNATRRWSFRKSAREIGAA